MNSSINYLLSAIWKISLNYNKYLEEISVKEKTSSDIVIVTIL